ncbi:MAG: hypothetical protein MZW92_28460 [Comamonadaceae bacterium]|nr:hypothetical protein [Comamonadaceae bacterium]
MHDYQCAATADHRRDHHRAPGRVPAVQPRAVAARRAWRSADAGIGVAVSTGARACRARLQSAQCRAGIADAACRDVGPAAASVVQQQVDSVPALPDGRRRADLHRPACRGARPAS